MSESNLGQFIEICLVDSDSESSWVRIAAYSQFFGFIDDDRIKRKVAEKIETEKDLEGRRLLQELADQIQKQSNAQQNAKDIKWLETIDQNEVEARVCNFLEQEDKLENLLWGLSLDKKFLVGQKVLQRLAKLLHHENNLVVARTFFLLQEISPDLILRDLIFLLKHPLPTIRIYAIKFLHKIRPAEALRLLNNMIETSDARQFNLCLSFMYSLPFEEIWPLLLKIIEFGGLETSTRQLLLGLVSTNPDPGFFKRLVSTSCLKGEEKNEFNEIIDAQLNALKISGVIGEDAQNYHRRIKDEVLQGLARLVGKDCRSTEAALPDPGAYDKVPQKNISRKIEKEIVEKSIESLIDDGDISENLILDILPQLLEKKIVSGRIINWLNHLLDQPHTQIKLLTMECLFKFSRKDLILHLPVLAASGDYFVASQAIRYLIKVEEKRFAGRLETWLKSCSHKEFDAAMIGLTQLKFSLALPIVINFIGKSSNTERIKQIINVLLINPDYSTISELKKISFQEASPEKKKLINEAMAQIKENLKLSRVSDKRSNEFLSKILDNPEIKEKWDDILLRIESLKYSIEESSSEFSLKKFVMIFFLLQAVVFGYLWFFNSPDDTSRKAQNQQSNRVKSDLVLKKGDKISGQFVEFDSFNRWWVVKTSEGKMIKTILSDNSDNDLLLVKFKGVVEAASFSAAGYPLIKLKILEIEK